LRAKKGDGPFFERIHALPKIGKVIIFLNPDPLPSKGRGGKIEPSPFFISLSSA
jgi:hypothetical protein